MVNFIRRASFLVMVMLLCYIPFHALISTWAIDNIGYEVAVKSVKDAVVFVMLAGLLVYFHIYGAKKKIDKRIYFLVSLFFTLNVIYLFFSPGNFIQKLAGFDFNLRFLAFFLITYFVGGSYKDSSNVKLVLKIIIVSLGVVSLFGLFQATLLPRDFLSHFGYNGQVIPSYFTIDGDGGLIRYASTLRGPNVLGAYMVVALPALISMWIFVRKELTYRTHVLFSLVTISAIAALYFSYSRSAWIGLVVSIVTYLFFVFKKHKFKMLIASVLSLVALVAIVIPNRDTYFVQQVVFHTDPGEQSEVNSDDYRIQSLKDGFNALENKVFGHGIGSSGTSSTYGERPIIIENYFLDIAYQFGYLGLLLVLLVYAQVFRLLWSIKNNWIAVSLMSSLIGLTIVGLFWPVWSDETVAYTWWGLAGIVLGSFAKLSNTRKDAVKLSSGQAKAKTVS